MSQTTEERWLPVVGYEGLYEVSNQGRVRSLDQSGFDSRGRVRGRKGRVLSPSRSGRGSYPHVVLSGDATRKIHCLVAEAFIGPRPDGLEVRHLNGDPADNRVENLVYGTSQENHGDMARHRRGSAFWTQCKRGHDFTLENTLWIIRATGKQRTCLTCKRERARAWARQKRRSA